MVKLLNGVLGPIIIIIGLTAACLFVIELVPDVSIKAMMRLFFITVIVLDLITVVWAIFYLRKKHPERWVSLIYPKM